MDRLEQFISELDELLKRHNFQMESTVTCEIDVIDLESPGHKLVGYFSGCVEKEGFTKL